VLITPSSENQSFTQCIITMDAALSTLMNDSKLQRGLLAASAVVCAGAALAYYIYSDSMAKASSSSGSNGEKKRERGVSKSTDTKSKPSSSSNSKTVENTADIMKGYKTLGDGRKTTYFNRELSAEDKSLLGDNAPKPIRAASASPSPALEQQPQQQQAGQSAWNAAGTWEEKDCSAWAKDRLKSILQSLSSKSGSDNISVTKVKDVEGEASITVVRGKKKYIYDYSLNMELKGTAGGSSFTGELNVQDITGENAHEVVDTECCLALDAD
jgi:activator of HSP90 ATPase